MKSTITQHIPSYVDYRDPLKTAEVQTAADLYRVEWLRRWNVPDFHRSSWSPAGDQGGHVMAELDGGKVWRVAASSDGPIDGLPLWEQPVTNQ